METVQTQNGTWNVHPKHASGMYAHRIISISQIKHRKLVVV